MSESSKPNESIVDIVDILLKFKQYALGYSNIINIYFQEKCEETLRQPIIDIRLTNF